MHSFKEFYSPPVSPPCSRAEMSWGVLDEEEFHRCCRLLLQQSERLRDGWSWEAVQVRRRNVCVFKPRADLKWSVWSLRHFLEWFQGSEGYLKKTALRPALAPETQEDPGSLTCNPCLSPPPEEQVLKYTWWHHWSHKAVLCRPLILCDKINKIWKHYVVNFTEIH